MRRSLIPLVFTITVAVAAACVPPTVPDPGVISPGDGHGRDDSRDVAPSRGCAGEAPGLRTGRSVLKVERDGVIRTSLVDVPTSPLSGPTPSPLLVSLHPFLMTPEIWDSYSGLASAATGRGYIVVTPLGSEPGPRWTVPGGIASGTDDLGFIESLVDEVESRACIDRNRVFAAGFSAGAAMAQALSCAMPERFAGIAGSGGVNLTSLCPESPGTDVLVLHGTRDLIVPLNGSQVPFALPAGLSVSEVVAVDAARAGCDRVAVVDLPAPKVRRERFVGCADGHRVESISLVGAGHTWAGSRNPLLELVAGRTNTDISATETVLDFFDSNAS